MDYVIGLVLLVPVALFLVAHFVKQVSDMLEKATLTVAVVSLGCAAACYFLATSDNATIVKVRQGSSEFVREMRAAAKADGTW